LHLSTRRPSLQPLSSKDLSTAVIVVVGHGGGGIRILFFIVVIISPAEEASSKLKQADQSAHSPPATTSHRRTLDHPPQSAHVLDAQCLPLQATSRPRREAQSHRTWPSPGNVLVQGRAQVTIARVPGEHICGATTTMTRRRIVVSSSSTSLTSQNCGRAARPNAAALSRRCQQRQHYLRRRHLMI
jgi:hypothetical protein